jgi:hypothetical protein
MRKVRSETFTTVTSGTWRSRSTTARPCASSEALKVTSRVISFWVTSTTSTAPMSPPASPMAEAMRPSMPGLLARRMRTVRLLLATGVLPLMTASLPG